MVRADWGHVETVREIDALVTSIRARFRPDEGSEVAGARLVKVIGVGNFGTVWEAVELKTQRRVAVKIFRLERLTEGQMLSRFRKSIRAMRLLSEEKRVAKYKEAIGTVVAFLQQDPTELAFSMELLTGGNLDEVSKHAWTLAHKLEVMSRVCTAVAYSHANGVIHRDIKPANIVLNDQGQPVLTDFDIADIKFATSMSTTVEGGLGTPVFAAPEQLENADLANERSDVYSLGRLLHYMLIERSPGYQVEKDPTLADLNGHPPALIEAVRQATQHDPARRFASVDQMTAALAKCQTGAAAWRARAARSRRWARHSWAVLVIMGLVVSGSAVAVVYQSAVAKRESAYRAKLEELSTALTNLASAKERATRELQAAEQDIGALSEQAKSNPSPEIKARLEEAEERREHAKAELERIDQQQRDIEQQIQDAKKAFGTASKSAAVLSKERAVAHPATLEKRPDSTDAVTDAYCWESSYDCRINGKCTARNGKCIATSDADCEKSDACFRFSACTAHHGQCVVGSGGD